jgi:hypothetical protein
MQAGFSFSRKEDEANVLQVGWTGVTAPMGAHSLVIAYPFGELRSLPRVSLS